MKKNTTKLKDEKVYAFWIGLIRDVEPQIEVNWLEYFADNSDHTTSYKVTNWEKVYVVDREALLGPVVMKIAPFKGTIAVDNPSFNFDPSFQINCNTYSFFLSLCTTPEEKISSNATIVPPLGEPSQKSILNIGKIKKFNNTTSPIGKKYKNIGSIMQELRKDPNCNIEVQHDAMNNSFDADGDAVLDNNSIPSDLSKDPIISKPQLSNNLQPSTTTSTQPSTSTSTQPSNSISTQPSNSILPLDSLKFKLRNVPEEEEEDDSVSDDIVIDRKRREKEKKRKRKKRSNQKISKKN